MGDLLGAMADCLEVAEAIPFTLICKLCESGFRFPKLRVLSCSPNWLPVSRGHLETLRHSCPALGAMDRVQIDPPGAAGLNGLASSPTWLPSLLYQLTCLHFGG